MSTENIKLSKGDRITKEGQDYKIAVQTRIKATKVVNVEELEPKEEEAIGEHKTDANDNQLKAAVCRIVQNKIKKLEQKEQDALFDIGSDDVLFEFDEAEAVPKGLVYNHIGATNTILDLQQILKEIKAL